nr:probable inorganic phosphate transporter 1-3 [Ipomoea batatas]GMD81619.1 probable inorganic phosphate transporter 1-3 [Ipomoea batatas]
MYLLSTCSAENLLETSLQSIRRSRSLAAGDTELKNLDGNLRLALSTASKISSAESPSDRDENRKKFNDLESRVYHNSKGFSLGEDLASGEALEEIGGAAELDDEMEVIVVLEDVEDAEDVGIGGEQLHDLRLVEEALSVDGVVGD